MEPWLAEVLTNRAFLVCGTITLICVVPSICHYWWKARRDELDSQLKHALLDRGMDTDTIIRVLEAGRTSPKNDDDAAEFRVERDFA